MVTEGEDVNMGPETLALVLVMALVTSDLGMVEENWAPFWRRIGVIKGGFVSRFCLIFNSKNEKAAQKGDKIWVSPELPPINNIQTE